MKKFPQITMHLRKQWLLWILIAIPFFFLSFFMIYQLRFREFLDLLEILVEFVLFIIFADCK